MLVALPAVFAFTLFLAAYKATAHGHAPTSSPNHNPFAPTQYVTLGCSCWFTGTATCPTSQPDFCRNCTKDWQKPLGTGTDRVPVVSTPNAVAVVTMTCALHPRVGPAHSHTAAMAALAGCSL